MEFYDEWLASGMHYYTEAQNMKSALHHSWILEAWAQLYEELIIRSFKHMRQFWKNDGSEDNITHCFKCAQPFLEGVFPLKDQVHILNSDDKMMRQKLKQTYLIKMMKRMILQT